jgi:hypothetical protein
LPPEIDLLEYCTAEDITFQVALRLFDSQAPYAADNIRRVRRVISIYTQEGLIVIKRGQDENGGVVKLWEVRFILADEATWSESPDEDHRFLLSLTPAGWDAFVDRSRDFFDRLFGKR